METVTAPVEQKLERPVPQAPFDINRVYEIPLEVVEADAEWNCRGYIDPTNVLELSASIRNTGLEQPVTVTPNLVAGKKPFKLIMGYRRFKAHQMIGLDSKIPRNEYPGTIRALIRVGINEVDARVLNLVENLQRENLNIKQEAHAIAHLRLLSQQDIAIRINKSRGWVQTRIHLLQLPDKIQDEAAAGLLTTEQIRKCAALGDEEAQYEYIRQLKDAKLKGNKREVNPEKIRPPAESRTRSLAEMEELQAMIQTSIGNNLATRVLGWATGYVSPFEVHKSIQDEAAKLGKFYSIPEGL